MTHTHFTSSIFLLDSPIYGVSIPDGPLGEWQGGGAAPGHSGGRVRDTEWVLLAMTAT